MTAVRTTLILASALGFLVGAASLPCGAEPAWAEQEAPKKSVDAESVYYGDAREWSKPAEVDPDAVYAQIEEYKRIVEEKIDPSDPKYGVLMSKARKRFMAALRTVAKDAGYDLIARVGSVKGVEGVPVVTQDVIAKL